MPITSISKIAIFPLVLLFLSACALHKGGVRKSDNSLSGTFFAYHTALGAGRGILFKVAIPAPILKHYSIDSFYLGGKPQAFLLRTIRDTLHLESTYFVSAPIRSVGEPAGPQSDSSQKISNEAILVKRQFSPSWIVVSGKKGNKRIDIIQYKEIFAQTKL